MTSDYEGYTHKTTQTAHVFEVTTPSGRVLFVHEDETGAWNGDFKTEADAKAALFIYINWLEGV